MIHKKLFPFVHYPVCVEETFYDRLLRKIHVSGMIRCHVCGRPSIFLVAGEHIRETCVCLWCRSRNRQRQIAYVVCSNFSVIKKRKILSLKELASCNDIVIYNTECTGAIHQTLSVSKNYFYSEYFGDEYKSGEVVNGVAHQDLMNLSFETNKFDLVISADVFEHIPDPYRAHREIYRVLKPGGRHVFSVPFYHTEFLDEQRTQIKDDGEIIMIKEPRYHPDPIRAEGSLVHTIFALQMLIELRKIGFVTHFYRLYKPIFGIVGHNAIIFEAIKV